MNVVTMNPKDKKQAEQRKADMLEVLAEITRQVEEGEITEFVACSNTRENECQIHVTCIDALGGVGMFEVGKQLLIEHEIR